MARSVALLRGINVGGGNKIAMAELRAIAGGLGWANVATYIQTGNVVFDAESADEATLAAALAEALSEKADLSVPIVVRPAPDLVRIANSHPMAESEADHRLLHVQLLDRVPDPERVELVAVDGFRPDTWVLDGREVYAHYPGGSGRSKLSIEVFERAWGVTATARNLRTIRKLAEMAEP